MIAHRGKWAAVIFSSSLVAVTVVSCKDPTGFSTHPASSSPAGNGAVPATGGGTGALVNAFNEDCPADDAWLPGIGQPTPDNRMFLPAPHPDTECPFYRGVYQNFLKATQPDANGRPAFLNPSLYPNILTAFAFPMAIQTGFQVDTGDLSGDPTKSPDPFVNPGGAAAAAAVRNGPPTGLTQLGIIHQAGPNRQIFVDQDHHSLYYGVQMNPVMAQFINDNGLTTEEGILQSLQSNPELELPPGVVLLKEAWKDIDPRDFPDSKGNLGTDAGVVPSPTDFAAGEPGDYSNYITTMEWVPWLKASVVTDLNGNPVLDSTGKTIPRVEEDPDHPVLRKLALVAIHVVYSYPGHPELVWGSIQHVNNAMEDPAVLEFAQVHLMGMPDTQPNSVSPDGGVPSLPTPLFNQDVTASASSHKYLMYAPNTPLNASMPQKSDTDLGFDEATQTFSTVINTYRMFDGAKADTLEPDSAVFSLNSNINVMYANAIAQNRFDPTTDKRNNYRLVAAVWMDKPALFHVNATLQNEDGTNPLINDILKSPPNVHPEISQGVTCGTPVGPDGESGDIPGATGFNNTVPGCDSRYDDLDLPDAGNPQLVPLCDGGTLPDGAPLLGPIDPACMYAQSPPQLGTDSAFSLLGGENRLSSTVMETFTQAGTFSNCFSCHNTKTISSLGVNTACSDGNQSACGTGETALIPMPGKINVTHFFSEFVESKREAAHRRGMVALSDGGVVPMSGDAGP
jgi:hypothetical protein